MGYKQHKDTAPMERELNYLLYDLCVKWGFCISADKARSIALCQTMSADKFATLILEAEQMDSYPESDWFQKIAAKFKERFGANEISRLSFMDRVRGKNEVW